VLVAPGSVVLGVVVPLAPGVLVLEVPPGMFCGSDVPGVCSPGSPVVDVPMLEVPPVPGLPVLPAGGSAVSPEQAVMPPASNSPVRSAEMESLEQARIAAHYTRRRKGFNQLHWVRPSAQMPAIVERCRITALVINCGCVEFSLAASGSAIALVRSRVPRMRTHWCPER
jgi:hypothetical protein